MPIYHLFANITLLIILSSICHFVYPFLYDFCIIHTHIFFIHINLREQFDFLRMAVSVSSPATKRSRAPLRPGLGTVFHFFMIEFLICFLPERFISFHHLFHTYPFIDIQIRENRFSDIDGVSLNRVTVTVRFH